MDLDKPINIEAVNNVSEKFAKVIRRLSLLSVNDTLKWLTMMPGITDAINLATHEHKTVMKPYTGIFEGNKKIGDIVPRRLTVYPGVAEISDEPERYRRSWMTDVAGGLDPNKHPFEKWLLETIAGVISEDLNMAVFNGVRNIA